MKIKNSLSPEEKKKFLDEAWLGVQLDEKKLINPLLKIPPQLEENPHLYFLYLMTRPEYFSFACKEILNVEILPFQAVVLKNLWNFTVRN